MPCGMGRQAHEHGNWIEDLMDVLQQLCSIARSKCSGHMAGHMTFFLPSPIMNIKVKEIGNESDKWGLGRTKGSDRKNPRSLTSHPHATANIRVKRIGPPLNEEGKQD